MQRPEVIAWIMLGVALATVLAACDVGPRDGDRCGNERLVVSTSRPGLPPRVTLTADGRTGLFLLDTGATFSTLAASQFGPGGTYTAQSFTLPGFPTGSFRLVDYWTTPGPQGRQLGVIGTDFLSLLSVDLDFERLSRDVVFGQTMCDAAAVQHSGLVPVRQNGFYTSTPARLAPGRPNVPVLYVRIGPVTTWAQIDTGYDDAALYPAIDINEALYRSLIEAGVPMQRERDQTVTTCQGGETRAVYRVAKVALETDSGAAIRSLNGVRLLVKPPNSCGGIATLREPAAQIGMSVVSSLGRIVFDPRAETVWVGHGKR